MKNIKDYLHLYLGCEVRTPDRELDERTHYGRTGTFIGFFDHTRLSCRIGFRAGPEGRVSTFMLKPILRPLSDMTDEEMLDWDKAQALSDPMECHASATVFLLLKGFDLFGLIESGLAISKVKEEIKK